MAPPGIEAAFVTGKANGFDRLAGLGARRGPEVPALGDTKHVGEFAARQARHRAQPGPAAAPAEEPGRRASASRGGFPFPAKPVEMAA